MEDKENISEYARRMRELAGLAEGNQNKSLKTIQEGNSSFEDGAIFLAKDLMKSNNKAEEVVIESVEDDEFETHEFEQKTIGEGADDEALYNLNENTIIVLDFLNEETQEESSTPEVRHDDDRKGPTDSATWHEEGKEMKGNDGEMWKIVTGSNNVNRWVKA